MYERDDHLRKGGGGQVADGFNILRHAGSDVARVQVLLIKQLAGKELTVQLQSDGVELPCIGRDRHIIVGLPQDDDRDNGPDEPSDHQPDVLG